MGLDEYFSKEKFYFSVMWSRDWPFWVKIRVFDKSDLVGRYLRNLKSNFVQIWNFLLFSTSPQKPCLRFLIKFFFLCEIYLQKWRVPIFFEKKFLSTNLPIKQIWKQILKFWDTVFERITKRIFLQNFEVICRENFFLRTYFCKKATFHPKPELCWPQ